MEKKIQYSLNLLSILFIVFTVVSAMLENPNNLYSVVYVGDTNITVGHPFWIQCLVEGPIEWYKDDQPIQQLHFIRHSKDDYGYVQHDEPFPNSRFQKSTIKVKHALMMHSGKYKCSSKHEKSHVLHVYDVDSSIVELDSENESIEDEYDDEIRRVSFEPPIIGDDALKSTMMMYVEEVSESNRLFSNFDESYEQFRGDSVEIEVTTQPIVTTQHKHNKHPIPTLIPTNRHPPHHTKNKHENHVLPTQQTHSVSMHEADLILPITTERTTTSTTTTTMSSTKGHREGSSMT